MDINTKQYKRCTVVNMSGRIDANTSPELDNAFKEVLENGKNNIVFDMSGVDFVASRGIWVILEAQKACKQANGELVITNVSDNILKSLDLAGVKHFVKIFPDIVSAVGSF